MLRDVPHRESRLFDFVGEGKYDLQLTIGELIQLQEKTGVGPHTLMKRFETGEWFVQDIIETVRLALIGGGMNPREAYEVVSRVIRSGYLLDYVMTSYACVRAALAGKEEDEPEEGKAEAPTTPMSPTTDAA